MINPIYKFELTSTYGSTVATKTVFPVHKSDLAIDWQIEQNEQYYRGKLSGKLYFVADDYDWINAKNFETEFELRLYISYNAGASWTQYWTGRFWKTDCEFDADNKKITVTPTVYDEYNDVVAGLEKEYNLIELTPVINHIQLDKRPMIQVYSPGESVVACFLSGMYWEQDATEESDETELTQTYYFAFCAGVRKVTVSGSPSPDVTGLYYGTYNNSAPLNTNYEYTTGAYKFQYTFTTGSGYVVCRWAIVRVSDSVELWAYQYSGQNPPVDPSTITLTPISGTGATGNITAEITIKKVFARYVLDVETLAGLTTYPIPADDIVSNNRNYSRCIGYAFTDVIYFTNRLTTTPTKYGIYQPGQYYQQPYLYWNPELFPVARSAWDEISIWFSFSAFDWITEQQGRKAYILKDAFPLSSVISVLLGQIAPDVKHEATTDYSRFLYGTTDPITGAAFTLFITQKSNILAGDYDQPAQKAPATLKMIMDMLRNCFRLYWFVDKDENGDYRFRIEHISWFLNGGTYSGTPVVGTDLTTLQVTRNGKPWAFDTSKYSYDKLEMPERYQFGWMDDVTELFEGYPINIESKFVQAGNIEEINVSNFTSDIDYMLLNPSACDEDGFALLAPTLNYDLKKLSFEQGRIMGGNRTYEESKLADNTRIRSLLLTKLTTSLYITIGTGYKFLIDSFDDDKIHRGNSAWYTQSGTITNNYKYAVLTIAKTDDSAILPSEISNISGIINGVVYSLPYLNFVIGTTDHYLQNAYLAFYWLQQYYMYDMPALSIDGEFYNNYGQANATKKQKTQDLQYPVYTDPNLYQLVKTNMGNGQIEKISINLSSRKAKTTLRYDTE